MQQKKTFHRHFATPGLDLYWIIIAYIIVGWFFPVVGLIALICMIGPVSAPCSLRPTTAEDWSQVICIPTALSAANAHWPVLRRLCR